MADACHVRTSEVAGGRFHPTAPFVLHCNFQICRLEFTRTEFKMPEKTLEDYWYLSFDALYDACFYELTSEHIIRSWNLIDLVISLCTACIIAGSAFRGWALWENPKGKAIGGCICGGGGAPPNFQYFLALPKKIP